MINTTLFGMSDNQSRAVSRALDIGAETGSYTQISRLPLKTRQSLVDDIFNNRSMEEAKGITGNQTGHNAQYFGFTTKMKPSAFLRRALDRGNEEVSKKKRKDFAYNLAKDLADGKNPKLGPPKLWGDIKDGKIVITGHEGRHRADAIRELTGGDTYIPVDFQLTKDGGEMRRRAMDPKVLDYKIVNQDGVPLKMTLRDLLPDGFDTSTLVQ